MSNMPLEDRYNEILILTCEIKEVVQAQLFTKAELLYTKRAKLIQEATDSKQALAQSSIIDFNTMNEIIHRIEILDQDITTILATVQKSVMHNIGSNNKESIAVSGYKIPKHDNQFSTIDTVS